ncbi:uncharacterized protein LOC9639918 isoform X2 [Selaginella moellendorffii]|uniref:uncharacterized protein LOC9639918 isoform X2 n=1 Tax=Selaginella moellendorffii TaxID=88036 RepID=UPI000D1C8D97|nr:uncharacterized protein LOC9639918 isoform X2 [Selaginella moellendorffii]|eukprot:XP_024515909.1 uncharacterized protein LOC9639918 isoform X2 [Selaginella moellendorffii]
MASWNAGSSALKSCSAPLPRARIPPGVRMPVMVAAMATKTCRNCKQQFDPLANSPGACRFHTAHYGGKFFLELVLSLFIIFADQGETKRKFESVYKGGTMNTSGAGEISHYWHCCGSPDPFDAGCQSSPHLSYDD